MVSLRLCVFQLALMSLRWVRMFMLGRLGAGALLRETARCTILRFTIHQVVIY